MEEYAANMTGNLGRDNLVKSYDPRIDFNIPTRMVYKIGGEQITDRVFNAQSASSSSITFSSLNPPSPNVAIDRKMFLKVGVRWTFNGPAQANGANLLAIGSTDAPKFMPFSQSIDSYNFILNNCSFTSTPVQHLEPLLRYSNNRDYSEAELSGAPSMQDTYTNYEDYLTYGSAKNVLGNYGENGYRSCRGGFAGITVVSNTPTQAIVDVITTEPIFLSPFAFGQQSQKGLIGISTMQLTVNISSQMVSSYWSCQAVAGRSFTSITSSLIPIGGPATRIEAPQLQITFITPKNYDTIPAYNFYPYHNLITYPTIGATLAPGQEVQTSVNNIQLSSIPSKVYIFIRQQRSTIVAFDVNQTDTYASILRVDMTFDNQSGILGGTPTEQLFRIAVRNGFTGTWSDWIKYTGSVLCLNFGTDISLKDSVAVGQGGTYSLLYTVTYKNINPTKTIAYEINTVVVGDGYMKVSGNDIQKYEAMFGQDLSELNETSLIVPWVQQDQMFYGAGLRDIARNIASVVKSKILPSARYVASLIQAHPELVKNVMETVLRVVPGGEALESFVKSVLAFVPPELKDRAMALLLPGKGMFSGGAPFSGGASFSGGDCGGAPFSGGKMKKHKRLIDRY